MELSFPDNNYYYFFPISIIIVTFYFVKNTGKLAPQRNEKLEKENK